MANISATELANLLADESFLNWISNHASAQESAQWNAWLNKSSSNRELYNRALDLHKLIIFPSAPGQPTSRALDRLNRQLDHADTPQTVDQPKGITLPLTGKRNSGWWKVGLAAIAATVLLFSTWQMLPLLQADAHQTLTTRMQEQQRLNLPDGSFVVLNANSTLRFAKDLAADSKREFYLNGEAYFEVATRPGSSNSEFTVHTSDGSVTVLGTVFAVYDRGAGTRVALEEGSIRVTSGASALNSASAVVQMIPGEVLNFQRGAGVLQPVSGATKLHTSWWKDSFVLDKTPVEELARRLRETYGINLIIQDPELAKRMLAGSVENHNPDLILKAVSSILQVPLKRQGDTIFLGNKPGKQ